MALPTIAKAKPRLTMHVLLARLVGTNPDPDGETLEMPCEWSGVSNAETSSNPDTSESATNIGIRFASVKLTTLIRRNDPQASSVRRRQSPNIGRRDAVQPSIVSDDPAAKRETLTASGFLKSSQLANHVVETVDNVKPTVARI